MRDTTLELAGLKSIKQKCDDQARGATINKDYLFMLFARSEYQYLYTMLQDALNELVKLGDIIIEEFEPSKDFDIDILRWMNATLTEQGRNRLKASLP